MPNIKSAKKRVLVENRRKGENRVIKSTIATYVKKFNALVKTDVASAEKFLLEVTSYIDSAESKGIIHKKTASRKISRLNLALNKAKNESVKVTKAEVETAKAEIKKEVEATPAPVKAEKPAKAPVKKAAAPKTTTKKTTSKKAE